jgi:hypothetical protein
VTVDVVLEKGGRSVVEAALVFFAAWTVVYQVALAVGLSSTLALALALVLGAGGLIVVFRRHDPARRHLTPAPAARAAALVIIATVVATSAAMAGHRQLAVWVLVVGAALGLAATARLTWVRERSASERQVPQIADPVEFGSPWLWRIGWTAALASAGMASVLARPDGDDAYFVNLSAWVAERGYFPLHDTMLSADVLPANSAHSPPVHSIEGLIGALARLADVEAGTVTYVLVPPLATFVAVLGITHLVQEARIPAPSWALAGVMGFLWTTGGSGYSLGNFFGVRIWQGKAMLVSVVLPLVLLLGARLIRAGTLRHHVLFGGALVASVGMSNTAVFLVPVLVSGTIFAALALHEVRGALRLVAWMAYPAAVGVVAYLLAPSRPSDLQLAQEGFVARAGRMADPLLTVPGRNGILVVTALAVGMGTLGLRERTIRTAVLGAMVAAGIALSPPVRDILGGLGLGSVVWRMWWVVPIPLLIGGTVGAAAVRVHAPRLVVAAAVAAAVTLVPLAGGKWIGSPANARLVTPMSWKVPPGALREARFVESVSRPGDTALVPWDTSRVLAALSVDVQPVSARRAYLRSYAGAPGAHAASRDELQEFADRRTPRGNALAKPLDELSVDTACVGTRRGKAVELLKANGFRVVGRVNNLTCLRR